MERVCNLEALRGIFSILIISIHIYLISGFLPEGLGVFKVLLMNHAPVDVFIILSGLVIFFLLETRKEPFLLYITRRALRIFPAYLVCLALLIPILSLSLDAVQSLPWHNTDFIKGEIGALSASIENFVPHLLAHVTLTNGMFGKWLPYSSFAFLGPAWSLSLEWQFYLACPLIWMCFKTRNRFVVALTIAVLTLGFWKFRFGEYLGFLPQKMPFFIIGIFCYYALKYRGQSLKVAAHWQTWAFLAAYSLWVGTVQGYEGMAMWFAVYVFCYFNLPILEHPITNYLGKISFSLYISHMIFVYAGILLLKGFNIQDRLVYFISLYAISMPMVIGFSHVLYHQVEKPCMDYAKHLCKQLSALSSAHGTSV